MPVYSCLCVIQLIIAINADSKNARGKKGAKPDLMGYTLLPSIPSTPAKGRVVQDTVPVPSEENPDGRENHGLH